MKNIMKIRHLKINILTLFLLVFSIILLSCDKEEDETLQYSWSPTHRISVFDGDDQPLNNVKIRFNFTNEDDNVRHEAYTDSQGVVKIDGNKTENTPLGGKCPYTIHVYSVSKDGYSLNYGGAFFIGEILDYAYERDRIVWVTYYMKPS